MLSNPTYCVNLSQSSCEESQKLLHPSPSRDVVASMLYTMYMSFMDVFVMLNVNNQLREEALSLNHRSYLMNNEIAVNDHVHLLHGKWKTRRKKFEWKMENYLTGAREKRINKFGYRSNETKTLSLSLWLSN